ncbi:MAG: alpha-1,2-fucosyltransferase [Cytophagales bacterium]|nr:MAG: alpha-1,2-fucosyltransferase [Cytophagales bacterium]
MIISKITSGLGNQLFQYALGRHLAVQNNTRLWFDLRYYHETYETDTVRHFKLDRFQIDHDVLDHSLWLYVSKATRLLPGRSLRPLFDTRKENHFHLDPTVSQARGMFVTLDGFWQSEAYFKESEAVIRRELTFKRTAGPTFEDFRQQISGATTPVSVHIRRGDYVNHPEFSQSFGALGMDYYETALAHLTTQHPDATLFVFSDDPDWVRQHMRFTQPHVFVTNTGPDADVDDLELMSLCRHHIIANSSFSWWGAWLNPRPDKIVIAPRQWFRNKPWDTKDLVPASWLRV